MLTGIDNSPGRGSNDLGSSASPALEELDGPEDRELTARLEGSRAHRFAHEFLTNSGHFPVANAIFELLIDGPATYLLSLHPVPIMLAGLVQTGALVATERRGWWWRLLGNLVGPLTYGAVELVAEGPSFFAALQHQAYWGFALVIGVLQALRSRWPRHATPLLLGENLIRTSIPFGMYGLFEATTDPSFQSVSAYFADRGHVFIGLVLLLLGLLIGLEQALAFRYLTLLRGTSAQLRIYAEWFLGRDLLTRAVTNPESLALRPRERAILFSDIRGFTRWSEQRSPGEVVAMLNRYYEAGERVLLRHRAIRAKFAADELMAPFDAPLAAARAGLELRDAVASILSEEGIAAGVGLHSGAVIEGMLGGEHVRGYDVIGDTVNTAKRIEGAAAGGEVLISADLAAELGSAARLGAAREIAVKGKAEPLVVYPLLGLHV